MRVLSALRVTNITKILRQTNPFSSRSRWP